ncbi:hypothetical protein DM02DRAFT_607107, partial [Periconia macrospinosa]
MSGVDLSNLMGGPHFRHPSVLSFNGIGFKLNSLLDTGAQGFLFINSSIAHSLSRKFRTSIQKLPRPVTVRGFQDSITDSARRYIRLHLRIDKRTILNCPFVILDLGTQDVIIGLKWMKRFQVRLDTENNRILWPSKYPPVPDFSPPILTQLRQPPASRDVERDVRRRDALWAAEASRERNSPVLDPILLSSRRGQEWNHSTPSIAVISANAFHYTMKRAENEFFMTNLLELDRLISDKRAERN